MEQEWQFIENNFKECKINRKLSNLKPPKCDFYKDLDFLEKALNDGNDGVLTYPDIPDIRVICNIPFQSEDMFFRFRTYFKMNDFRCSCSRWKHQRNPKNDMKEILRRETQQVDTTILAMRQMPPAPDISTKEHLSDSDIARNSTRLKSSNNGRHKELINKTSTHSTNMKRFFHLIDERLT